MIQLNCGLAELLNNRPVGQRMNPLSASIYGVAYMSNRSQRNNLHNGSKIVGQRNYA